MKYLAYALVLMFGFALIAQAERITFRATWEHPVSTDGTPDPVDEYVLYVCDKPIPESFGDSLSGDALIAKCPDGKLEQYDIPATETSFEGVYESRKKKGEVFGRLSARRVLQTSDGEVERVESDLADQNGFTFFIKPGKPRGFNLIEVKE